MRPFGVHSHGHRQDSKFFKRLVTWPFEGRISKVGVLLNQTLDYSSNYFQANFLMLISGVGELPIQIVARLHVIQSISHSQ